jgi:hypothetical protein
MKPRFHHDCDRCTFLGHHDTNEGPFDLYHCTQTYFPTVIARYGDKGPEYASGLFAAKAMLESGKRDHPLAVAFSRAQELGLRL